MGRRGNGFGSSIQNQMTANVVPIIFTIFYGVLLLYYSLRASQNPTQVFIALSLFCAIRVTTFVLYATISDDKRLRRNPESVTLSVFLSVGFLALLYSTYALVLDRGIATGIVVKHPITRVTSNRYLVCFALAVAFVLGIATFVCGGSQRSTFALHETYAIIFLAVTILLGIHVVFQIMAERATLKQDIPPATPKTSYKTYIPCLILILLLIHEIYYILSINLYIYNPVSWRGPGQQWSLLALPEILAVFLFAIPDLVPKRKSLALHAHGVLGRG